MSLHALKHQLETIGVNFGYDTTHQVLSNVDVTIPAGQISVIIGANACGKSTLLKTMARVLTPTTGSVQLDGTALPQIPTRALARQLGLLPQQPIAPEGIAVADLVARGRHPHQGVFFSDTQTDRDAVAQALAATGTTHLANRSIDELSGGQRQRVWIAMALAQNTDILLLDEPTTFLDLAHQVEVLDLLAELNARCGTTIVMVLHDINLAARYADYLIAMKDGAIIARGAPAEIVTEELMRQVFDLNVRVLEDPVSTVPMVVLLGRHHVRGEQ